MTQVTFFDRLFALGATILLSCVLVALFRGEPHWSAVPAPI